MKCYLQKSIAGLKHQQNTIPVDDPDATVRAVIHTTESSDNHVHSVARLLYCYSSWYRLKKSGVSSQNKGTLFFRIQHKTQLKKQLRHVQDLQKTEVITLKFIKKIICIRNRTAKERTSCETEYQCQKMDAILDDGLNRVCGRLHIASLSLETKQSRLFYNI